MIQSTFAEFVICRKKFIEFVASLSKVTEYLRARGASRTCPTKPGVLKLGSVNPVEVHGIA